MAGKTAILKVSIIGDATKAEAALAKTQTATERFQQGLDRAAVGASVALAGLGAYASTLWTAGENAGTSAARIEQIATSMGYAGEQAGQLTDRLVESADAMALNTGIDPNVIKQGQATLLTFRELAVTADEAGGAFDRATTLAADLSAAGFGSMESASTMLGKALQDPVRGVTALRRVGVQLSDEQTEQIQKFVELGDTASAQAIVLEAVEQQVGGVAEATANSSDQMKVKWQLLQEELGSKLMPLFDQFAEIAQNVFGFLADHSEIVVGLGLALGTVAGAIVTLSAAMRAYQALQKIQTAIQWAQNAAWLASPITWIVLAIVAVIAAIILLWQNWDEVWAWISDTAKAFADWFSSLWDGISEWWNGLLAGIGEWWASVWDGAGAFIASIGDSFRSIWDGVASWFNGLLDSIGSWWKSIWDGAASFIRGIVDGIKSTWQGIVDWFYSAFQGVADFIGGIFGGIRDAINGIGDFVGGLLSFDVSADGQNLAMVAGTDIPAYMEFASPLSALSTQSAPALRAVRPSTAFEQHVTNIDVTVEGALDPNAVARQIRDILKRGKIVGVIS